MHAHEVAASSLTLLSQCLVVMLVAFVRPSTAQDLLDCVEKGKNAFKIVIRGGDTWFYDYDSETNMTIKSHIFAHMWL